MQLLKSAFKPISRFLNYTEVDTIMQYLNIDDDMELIADKFSIMIQSELRLKRVISELYTAI